VAVSAVAVLVPVAGASAAVWQAVLLVASGEAGAHWAETLLLLACLACAGTLLWATAAAVAGVHEGWRTGADAAARPAPPVVGGPRPSRAAPGRPGHVLAATVAAVVVAALTTGPATASARPSPWPAPSATAPAPVPSTSPGPVAPSPPDAEVAVADGEDAPDGTWGALADPPVPRTPVPVAPPRSGPCTGSRAAAGSPSTGTVVSAAVLAAVEPFRAPRAVDPATTALLTGTPSRSPDEHEVVVRSGDSLWSLVEAHLGPRATDDEVARTWPSWWQANRTTIGEDPDRLVPGQRLVVPVP